MRTLAALSAAALAAVALASPARAGASHDKFTDTFVGEPYDCVTEDGTVVHAQDAGTVQVRLTVTQRGSSPFPYFTEADHGTVTTTNLDTGRGLVQVFQNNFHDLKITDNHDGTITIVSKGSGGTKWYDTDGNFIRRDPGTVRFEFTLDYNGTPTNTEDDVEIEGSFHVVKPSTGNSDFSDRDFCADLLEVTS